MSLLQSLSPAKMPEMTRVILSLSTISLESSPETTTGAKTSLNSKSIRGCLVDSPDFIIQEQGEDLCEDS